MQFIDCGTAPGHLTKLIFPVVVLNSIITILKIGIFLLELHWSREKLQI